MSTEEYGKILQEAREEYEQLSKEQSLENFMNVYYNYTKVLKYIDTTTLNKNRFEADKVLEHIVEPYIGLMEAAKNTFHNCATKYEKEHIWNDYKNGIESFKRIITPVFTFC